HHSARATLRRRRTRGRGRRRAPSPGLARPEGSGVKRALVAVLAVVTLVAAGCGSDDPPPATTAAAPAPKRLQIIFPEGQNVMEMGERVAAVRRIAIAKRAVTPKLTRQRYLAAVANAKPPAPFLRDWKKGSMEGFLFPALYDFTQFTTGKELVDDQLTAF